jgi:thiamine-monophosphate kinase
MKIKYIGELKLIARAAKRFRQAASVVKGPGDDAAVIRWTKGRYLLFTCDMLVEGTHFRKGRATPFQIGWKAMARNISDIAAMGGIPRYALVSAAMRPDEELSFFDGIVKGLKAAADAFGVSIVGGDMSRSSAIAVDVSLIGEVEETSLVRRDGAKVGDCIFMTGSVGGSIKRRHLEFMPRLAEARKIVRAFKVNSMIDVSDGLALDLRRILDASSAGARIYENAIPISKDANSFDTAITDGEDFELIFTMSPQEAKRFLKKEWAMMTTPVTLIGEVMPRGYGYKLIRQDSGAEELKVKGYLHF